ncbi:uncharacterized protein LOC129807354 isoform X2 [Phlebotomus papatasi]|uniref:uncharacterized protein LOC129807354 isoform X2 n=1 Tax=Phlebotomus papatasi TaxID=29031 RepID=UPI0024843B6B|nr:uncharacterized protein LOC129807354 isoform X2 [Phlebotomus papatasi]XP_055712541.1 uncharacterized protein LOC129807354 isoform X2 [Phlebotomus papatasi]
MEIPDDLLSLCSKQTEPFEALPQNNVIGSEVNWEKRIEYVSKWLKETESYSSKNTMGQQHVLPVEVVEISDDDSDSDNFVSSESVVKSSAENIVNPSKKNSEVRRNSKRHKKKHRKGVKKVRLDEDRPLQDESFPAGDDRIQEQRRNREMTTQHASPFAASSSQSLGCKDEPVPATTDNLDMGIQTEEIKVEVPIFCTSSFAQTESPVLEETPTQTPSLVTLDSSAQTTNPVFGETSTQTSPPFCFNSSVQTDAIIRKTQNTQTIKVWMINAACQTDAFSFKVNSSLSPVKSPERKMNSYMSRERNNMMRAIDLVNSQRIKEFMMLSTMYQSLLDQIGMTQYLLKRNGDSIWDNVQKSLLLIQKTMTEKAVVHLSNVKPAFMEMNSEEREFFKKILMETALDWVKKSNTPVKVNLEANPFAWMIDMLNKVMSDSNVENKVEADGSFVLKVETEGTSDQSTTVLPVDHSPAYGDLPPESNTFGPAMTIIPINSSPLVATMQEPFTNDVQNDAAMPVNSAKTSAQIRVSQSPVIETSMSSQVCEPQVSQSDNVNSDSQLENNGIPSSCQVTNQCIQIPPQGQPAVGADQESVQQACPNYTAIAAVTHSILSEYAQSVPKIVSPILSPNTQTVNHQSNHLSIPPRLPVPNWIQILPTPRIPNQCQIPQANSLQRQAILNVQQQGCNNRPQVSVSALVEQHQQMMQQNQKQQTETQNQPVNLSQHSGGALVGSGPCTSLGSSAPGPQWLQPILPLTVFNNSIPVPFWRHPGPQPAHQNISNPGNFIPMVPPISMPSTSYSQIPPWHNVMQNPMQIQHQNNSVPRNIATQPRLHAPPIQQIQQGGCVQRQQSPLNMLNHQVSTLPPTYKETVRKVKQRRASSDRSPKQRKARPPQRRTSVYNLPKVNQPTLETWNSNQQPLSTASSMQITATSTINTQPQQQQPSSVLQTNHQMQSPTINQVPSKQKHHRGSTETSFISSQQCSVSPQNIPHSQSQTTITCLSSIPDLSQLMSEDEFRDLQRVIQNLPGVGGNSTVQLSSSVACEQIICPTIPTQATSDVSNNPTKEYQIRPTPTSKLMPPPPVPTSRVRRGRQMSVDSYQPPKTQMCNSTVNYSQSAGILQGTSGQTESSVKTSPSTDTIKEVVNLPHVQSQLWAHFMGSFYQSRKNLQNHPQVEQRNGTVVEKEQQESLSGSEQNHSLGLEISHELIIKLKRTMKICTICVTNNTNMVCSTCLSAAYCSNDCEAQDTDHSCKSGQFIFL